MCGISVGVAWVGGSEGCSSGALADFNVIGMTIRAVGVEGDDDIWADSLQMGNDFRKGFNRACLVEIAVDVIQN